MRVFVGLALVFLTACTVDSEQASAQIPDANEHLWQPTQAERELLSLTTKAEKHLKIIQNVQKIDTDNVEEKHTLLFAKIDNQIQKFAPSPLEGKFHGLPTPAQKNILDKRAEKIESIRNRYFKRRDALLKQINDRQRAPLACIGVAQQGGAVLCKTTPNAKVKVARSETDFYFENADENGQIIIGFDRDEKKNFVEVAGERVSFDLKPRDYDTSRIDGLPPSQVSTFSEAQLKRIRSSSARKKVGFSSRAKEMGFKDGFDLPIKAEFIKTTNFGAQRILNGEPKKPHYGVDLAAPVGTPIYAPADGIVSLADNDLYFEGAMVLLDHGQGLISMYLHMDEILVQPGQVVKQGEQIATVGSKGRSTGPHLCWRLKWRNRNLDPLLLTEWPQQG